VFVDLEQLAIEAACEFVGASVLPCLEMIPALDYGEGCAGKPPFKVIDRSLTRPMHAPLLLLGGCRIPENQKNAPTLPQESENVIGATFLTTLSVVYSLALRRITIASSAQMELFDYIEVFYNQRRRHSTLGQISPAAFERRAMTQAA
jgi:hypothetical protein